MMYLYIFKPAECHATAMINARGSKLRTPTWSFCVIPMWGGCDVFSRARMCALACWTLPLACPILTFISSTTQPFLILPTTLQNSCHLPASLDPPPRSQAAVYPPPTLQTQAVSQTCQVFLEMASSSALLLCFFIPPCSWLKAKIP